MPCLVAPSFQYSILPMFHEMLLIGRVMRVKVLFDGVIRVSSPSGWPFAIAGTLSWSVDLRQPSRPWIAGQRMSASSAGLVPECQKIEDGMRFSYARLGESPPLANIELIIDVRERGDELSFSAALSNKDPEWTVRAFRFPVLDGIAADGASLLWPNGLGQRFTDLSRFGAGTLHYPSGTAAMPWFSLAGENGGLYLGSHDPGMSPRTIDTAFDKKCKTLSVGVGHLPFVGPGGAWGAPEFVIAPYDGPWQAAARRYRAWYDGAGAGLSDSKWARESSGWLLAVMKQQNGDVMWDYRSGIDRLCDIAAAHGLDTLGLFGWAHGGHDRFYPDYIPDPLMGGESALKDALSRARSRGIRTILYANGMIMDVSTDFFRDEGNEVALLDENMEAAGLHSIRKFHSSTPVIFARACTGSSAWRARMLALAEQANALGADGILYDQVGVYGPACCFGASHGHAVPAAGAAESAGMIREIAESMKKRNPEFVVMSEGVNDSMLGGVGYFHGWGCGFAPSRAMHNLMGREDSFPALFRVSFPEVPLTQRQPNPALDRNEANYAAVHGIRHEIETRYRPDVLFLTLGTAPGSDAYADCAYYPPDVNLLARLDPAAARSYLLKLIVFEQQYAAFLRRGRFMGDEGFIIDDPRITANAFSDGKRVAVCAWNSSGEPRQCSVSIPGRKLVECAEPENEVADPSSPVPPESVRIYVFDR